MSAQKKRFVIPMLGLTPHGGNRVLVEVANQLAAAGHSVTILAPNRPSQMPYVLSGAVHVKKIGPALSRKLPAWAVFLSLAPFYMGGRHILANHFLTVFPSWLAARLLGARYLYLVQDIEYRFYGGRFFRLLKWLCEWTYRRGRLVAANAYLAAELAPYGQPLLTLQLGVADSFFNTPASAQAKAFDVLYLPRRERHKRLDRFDALLPAMLSRGWRVLCVSQDQALLDTYADRVSVLRPAGDAALVAAMDSARMLLLTSDHEGFALPPLEAMARGVPTVMYPCGGPGVYARDDDNCLLAQDATEATALALAERLLADPALYARLSEAGRDTAQGFSLHRAVASLVGYAEDLG